MIVQGNFSYGTSIAERDEEGKVINEEYSLGGCRQSKYPGGAEERGNWYILPK